MSRPTRRSRTLAATQPRMERRPSLLVWLAYGLGILGTVVLVASALFLAGGYFSADDVGVGISVPAIVFWSGLVVIGAGTWAWRRFVSRA
jgi:hypothetical protein